MDAWLREAEEASQWVEDLESRHNHKNLNLADQTITSTSFSVNVVQSARSKLLELGVKLDRLESLLRNPPTKPILTDEDVDFRWKMLSDIQLRTRTLARSLYALPSLNRPKNDPATGSKEYNIVSTDYYDQDLVKTSYSQDISEMLNPLLIMQAEVRHIFNRLVLCQQFHYGRLALFSFCSWEWLPFYSLWFLSAQPSNGIISYKLNDQMIC